MTNLNRRNFLGIAAQIGATRPLRVGFVGVGARGSYHLDVLLGMNVEIKALCDVDEGYLRRASRWVVEAKQPAPDLYTGKTDYLRLCDRNDLDLVVTATPWQFHAPICIAAMKAGKHAATEVPAALGVDECWEMVDTSEKSGKHAVMLEQVNYSPEILTILHMAQQGLFGELNHASGGYVHDLRMVQFSPEEEPWRLQHSIDRNGNLYPTHPIGPISWWLDINRGDRFEHLVSMSTRAACLNEFAGKLYGEKHPYATAHVSGGDVNTTLLRTVEGKIVALHFDTSTPHPQTGEFRLQGTHGLYAGNTRQIYIEGRSPKNDQWQPLSDYSQEYQHPLWKGRSPNQYKTSRGHGGADGTPLLWERLLDALRSGRRPDMDVYDAATWSVISPLTERSVAAKSRPVDFPDFTRGKYKNTPPIKLV